MHRDGDDDVDNLQQQQQHGEDLAREEEQGFKVQYDAQFVELLKNLDPSVVNDELILAANSALQQKERARARWARLGWSSALTDAASNNNDNDNDSEVEDDPPKGDATSRIGSKNQKQTFDDDDDDSVSSSSSSSSSSSEDDAIAADDQAGSSRTAVTPSPDSPHRSRGDNVATAFCRSFLAPRGAVEHFVRDVRATAQTLQSLRATIKRFSRRIDGVASEVGLLQSKARHTERSLVNTHNVRQLTSSAIDALIPSLDAARVLSSAVVSADDDASSSASVMKRTASDLPEMGRQVVHSVRQLEKLLQARQVRVLNIAAVAQHSPDPRQQSSEEIAQAVASSILPAASSSSSSSSVGASSLVLDLRQAPALETLSSHVVDSVARQTCLLVRNFVVPRVATVLGKPRTNITIQQRSALLPYRALVKFLKSCATNPEFLAMNSNHRSHHQQQQQGGAAEDTSLPVLSAAEAAGAFYAELKATYIHYAACVYVTNFQIYMSQCLALQHARMFRPQDHSGTTTTSTPPLAPKPVVAVVPAPPASSSLGGSSGGFFDGWFSSGAAPATPTAPISLGIHVSSSASFPCLADVAGDIAPSEFSSRFVSTARNVQVQIHVAHPVLPIVQKAQLLQIDKLLQQQQNQVKLQQQNQVKLQQQRLALLSSPLETFRSVQLLLCEVVTSEFLFSFEFFDGDTDVYSGVFRPVVDVLVQFVMAHFLPSQQQQQQSRGAVDAQDVVGLGLLSLITLTFRSEMHRRSLHCLDEYYSHVLALLLPCTKRAVDMQLASLRSFMGQSAVSSVASPGSSSSSARRPSTTSSSSYASPSSSSSSSSISPQQQQQQAHLQALELFMRANGISGSATSLLCTSKPQSPTNAALLMQKTHPVVERFAHLSFALRSLLLRMSPAYNNNNNNNNASNNSDESVPPGATASPSDQHHMQQQQQQQQQLSRHESNRALTQVSTASGSRSRLRQEKDETDDMLQALCSSCKLLFSEFAEWLKSFSKFFARSCFAPLPVSTGAAVAALSSSSSEQRRYQSVPEQLEAVFSVRNLSAVLNLWAQLGFAARVENKAEGEGENNSSEDQPMIAAARGRNGKDDDGNSVYKKQQQSKQQRFQDPLSTSQRLFLQSRSDATAEFVVDMDRAMTTHYGEAVDELAYDVLHHLMSDVIFSVRDAEVKIQHLGSSSDCEMKSAPVEQQQQQHEQLPVHLEAAARRFAESAKDIPSKIAFFCQRALSSDVTTAAAATPLMSASELKKKADEDLLYQQHPLLENCTCVASVNPQLDVMKRAFTQLLLWNTRLHAALGIFLGSAGAGGTGTGVTRQQQQQRLRGMTVSNVQLSQWMQQVLS